jgi:predicted Zn-dependent protease
MDAFLWRASDRGPEFAVWALPELQRRATASRNTLELLRVAKAMARFEPNSDPVRNNIAFYSLLLNVGASQAWQNAEALYAKYPADPAIVSTYALSLLLRNRAAEALACLEKLPEAARQSAQIAPYYALALAGTGDSKRATEVLSRNRREPLLPEEEALLKKAQL